jgi:hypothetical protein
MSSTVEDHVLERIGGAPISRLPSPHFYVENVFPEQYYRDLRAMLPADGHYTCLGDTGRVPKGSYRDRFVFIPDAESVDTLPSEQRDFWSDFRAWFLGARFLRAMAAKYPNAVATRFGDTATDVRLFPESILVRDRTGYAIGPHTDAPHRFVTMLFYCPPDDGHEDLGTSIYVPKKIGFTSPGGPHFDFGEFVNVETMRYRPNSLFCFLNTNACFHGVETIADPDIVRDIILYVVRIDGPSVPLRNVAEYA